ncbi:MAG: Rieske 2Fe-2S domain-containing protein [Spirosomataceae bacterium]
MKTQEAITTMDRQEFFRLVGVSIGAIVLQQCLSGCGTGTTDPQPDDSTKDFSININNTNFTALRNAGGFVRSNGIIIARTQQGGFIAVSQACTHEGTAVNYVSSNNTFLCPNHGSVFTSEGEVQTGPATKPLTRYKTSFDASTGDVRVFS